MHVLYLFIIVYNWIPYIAANYTIKISQKTLTLTKHFIKFYEYKIKASFFWKVCPCLNLYKRKINLRNFSLDILLCYEFCNRTFKWKDWQTSKITTWNFHLELFRIYTHLHIHPNIGSNFHKNFVSIQFSGALPEFEVLTDCIRLKNQSSTKNLFNKKVFERNYTVKLCQEYLLNNIVKKLNKAELEYLDNSKYMIFEEKVILSANHAINIVNSQYVGSKTSTNLMKTKKLCSLVWCVLRRFTSPATFSNL